MQLILLLIFSSILILAIWYIDTNIWLINWVFTNDMVITSVIESFTESLSFQAYGRGHFMLAESCMDYQAVFACDCFMRCFVSRVDLVIFQRSYMCFRLYANWSQHKMFYQPLITFIFTSMIKRYNGETNESVIGYVRTLC